MTYTPGSVRFSLADKATGECVGVITLRQGKSVLDMSQVELCKVEDAQELFDQDTITQCDTSGDSNNNGIDSVKSIGVLVTDFVNQIERNCQLKSDVKRDALKARVESLLLKEIKQSQDAKNLVKTKYDMKPFKVGWLRRVSVSQNSVKDVWYVTPSDTTDGTRQELRRREDIMKYLIKTQYKDLTGEDFLLKKELLGLPAGYESSITLKAGTNSPENFKKPFVEGWLRTVVIRTSDYSVTAVAYFSPPDSDGKRLRFTYKKDIAEFLERNGIKSIDVDDFVCVRKVIGVSANFELITYRTQECRGNGNSENNNTSIKCNFDKPLEDDKDLSFDTVVNSSKDDSDDCSSDSSNSSSDFSNSNLPVFSKNIDYNKNSDTAGETDVPVSIVDFNGPHMHREVNLTKVGTSDDLATIVDIAGSRAHGGPDPEQDYVDNPTKGLVFSNDMAEVCRHKCHICRRLFSLPAMRSHTRTVHSMSIKQYCETFGNYRTELSKVVYHRCGYCNKELLLDMDKIHTHIRKHGVKLSEYSAKFLKLTMKK